MTVSQIQKMVWPHLFASSLDLSNTGQNTTHSYNYCEKFIDKLFTGCPSLVGITPGMASPCVQHVSWGWHVVFPSCVSSSCDSAGFDCESLRNPKLSPQKTEMLLTGLEKSSELSQFALTHQPRLYIYSLYKIYRLLLLFIATDAFSSTFSHTSAFSPLLGKKTSRLSFKVRNLLMMPRL